MIKVSLTGSKFSGKNYVSKLLRESGVKVFDADTAIKYLLNYHMPIITAVKSKFGSKSVENFYINKRFFDSDKLMMELLKVVESELFSLWNTYVSKYPDEDFIIFKCSCLYEMGWEKLFDEKVTIFISPNKAKDRNSYLHKNSNSKIYDLDKELCPYIKNSKSSIVIHNYHPMDINKQIIDLKNKLKEVINK